MSALKTPRRGIVSAVAGLIGFSALSGVLVTAMVAPALAVTGITASSTIGIFDGLPDYLEIGQQPERNAIYAKYTGRGSVDGYYQIATIYDQNRQEVGYNDISQFAIDAVVAGEDRRFFEHGGVDLTSLVRAAVGNVVSSGIESGASTLTMQLVKNTFISKAESLPNEDERKAAFEDATRETMDRKLKEMKLAIGLEKRYTKKEILTAYLNIANFGNATYGIQAAAQRYYSVSAKDLTLEQAASLVAIVQKPSTRNLSDPENYEANQDRRDVILYAMLDVGAIDQEQYDAAVAIPVDEETVVPSAPNNGCIAAYAYAKWFCDYVVKSVPDFEFLGATKDERNENWKQGGYKLYTTLDLDAQIPSQKATWTYAPNNETAFKLPMVAELKAPPSTTTRATTTAVRADSSPARPTRCSLLLSGSIRVRESTSASKVQLETSPAPSSQTVATVPTAEWSSSATTLTNEVSTRSPKAPPSQSTVFSSQWLPSSTSATSATLQQAWASSEQTATNCRASRHPSLAPTT